MGKERIGKGEKMILSFLKLFGGENDWSIGPIWNVAKKRITRALSPPGSPQDEMLESGEDTTDDEGRTITTRNRRSTSQHGNSVTSRTKNRKRTRADHNPSPVRSVSSTKKAK